MPRSIPLLTALTVLIALSAPAAAQGPWARLPALPTACYTKSDAFDGDGEKLRLDLDAAIGRQEEVNKSLVAKYASLDMMTQQSRLQAFMMKNPEAAGKYLEDQSNMAARMHAPEIAEKRNASDEKLKTIQAQYVAEAAPLTPLFTRYRDATEPAAGDAGHARIPEYAAAYDAAYERFCGKWWSATSPFVPWLGELKRLLVDAVIPEEDDMARVQKLQLDVMGIPAAGYKSTAELKAVREYLAAARKIYAQRPATPVKEWK